MKTKKIVFMMILMVAILFTTIGCEEQDTKNIDKVYQVSTLNALIEGNYKGFETTGELKEKGDLGIGTFHSLDGELVMIDGEVYQVKASGEVLEVKDDMTVPFAAVTSFEKDVSQELSNMSNYDSLTNELDTLMDNKEYFYAFRIDGFFDYVKTRSVPAQEEPYPLLSEVTKNQPIFEYENVEGSLVGFWCPEYVGEINVPGYHLHFISSDRTKGGHLLDVRFSQAQAYADKTTDFEMKLPMNVTSVDIANAEEEIEKVEK